MPKRTTKRGTYPVAFCPGPCRRAVSYSNNPNDRKTRVTVMATKDSSGILNYCPKCHIYFKILDLPKEEPGMTAVPIVSFGKRF